MTPQKLSIEQKARRIQLNLIKIIRINMIFLGRVYIDFKNEILKHISLENICSETFINLNPSIFELFNHPDFENFGFSASEILENTLNLMIIEKNQNIDLQSIIETSGVQNVYEGYKKKDFLKLCKMTKETLLNEFKKLVALRVSDHNLVYGQYGHMIAAGIDRLSLHSLALVITTDHTRVTYGSSGLNHASTGLDQKVMKQSPQPRLSCTVIAGQNGKTKRLPAIILRWFCKNKSKNKMKMLLLHNNDNAIDNDLLIFSQKTGSATGVHQCQYSHYMLEQMPKATKLMHHDTAQPNRSWKNQVTLKKFKCMQIICGAHLTGELQSPDDLFFHYFKNGVKMEFEKDGMTPRPEIPNGVKLDIQTYYDSEEAIVENDVLKPMDPKILIPIILKNYNAINPEVMLNSMFKCGNLLLSNLRRGMAMNKFLLISFLVNLDSLPSAKITPKKTFKEVITILKSMAEDEKYCNQSQKVFSCPIDKCNKVFKREYKMVDHFFKCKHVLWESEEREKLHHYMLKLKYDEENKKEEGYAYLALTKDKKPASKKFMCPANGCKFSRNWKDCKRGVIRHICPGIDQNDDYCEFGLTKAEIMAIFNSHPLFENMK